LAVIDRWFFEEAFGKSQTCRASEWQNHRGTEHWQ